MNVDNAREFGQKQTSVKRIQGCWSHKSCQLNLVLTINLFSKMVSGSVKTQVTVIGTVQLFFIQIGLKPTDSPLTNSSEKCYFSKTKYCEPSTKLSTQLVHQLYTADKVWAHQVECWLCILGLVFSESVRNVEKNLILQYYILWYRINSQKHCIDF